MALPPLYKYLDVQGAKLTLGNRTFKQTKPTDFNDTEDLTIQSIFPEEVETALTKLASSFNDFILKNVNEPPTCDPPMRDKVALLQNIYRNDPAAADAVREAIEKDGAKTIFDFGQSRARSQSFIEEINEFMRGFRVLCVTTHKDSERMWTEYAQKHEGIVLRIEPCIEKDSKFQLFRRVEYRASRPPLYHDTLDFLTGSLFGNQENRKRAMVEKIIYAKTLEWEHESEYRLVIPLRQGEDWNTLRYHPEEITELYLGLAMTKEDKEEIIGKAKTVSPNIAIFQAVRGANQTLTFPAVLGTRSRIRRRLVAVVRSRANSGLVPGMRRPRNAGVVIFSAPVLESGGGG